MRVSIASSFEQNFHPQKMSSPAVRRRAAAAASKPNTPASIAKSKAAKAQQKRDENWLKDAWLFTALTLSGIAIGLLAFVFFYSEGMGIGNIFKRSVPTFDAAAGAGRHDSSASTNGTTTQEQRVICSMPLPADYGCSESSCPLPTKEAGNCAAKYAQMDTVAELRMVDRNPVISVLEASPAKGSQPRHTVLLGPREHDDGGNINSYTRQPPTDNCATPAVNVTVVSTDPWLIVLDGFLTDEEVEHAMKLGVPGLQPSGQFHGDEEAKKAYDASYRTSSTAYLGKVRDPIVTCIERRASHFSAYPIGNIEALQFLRYNIGQEYKHHWLV